MISLTTTPPFAAPSDDVTVHVAMTAGNYCRVWCTSAPAGSELSQRITDTGGRVEVHTGGVGSFRFDGSVPGGYVFDAQEILRTASAGSAGYQGAPGAAHTEQVVGTSTLSGLQTVTVHIGTRLTVDVGAGADRATLALWVWDDTIRATTVADHGEVTPSLTLRPAASDLMRSAIATSQVRQHLESLAGADVVTAIGDVDAYALDFVTEYGAHIADATAHANADTHNGIPQQFAALGNAVEWFRAAAEMFARHAQNNQASSINRGGQDYHEIGSILTPDLVNLPIVSNPANIGEAMFGLADLWEAYERHRVSNVHTAPDTTHALAPLPPLLELYRLISVGLRDAASTPSPTVNEGAAMLRRVFGMGG